MATIRFLLDKVEEIGIGWKNFAIRTQTIEEIAKKRLAVCFNEGACKYLNFNHIVKEMSKCILCRCPVGPKSRNIKSTAKGCPMQWWPGQKDEIIIDDYSN